MKIEVVNVSKEIKNNNILNEINMKFNEGKILVDGADITKEDMFLPDTRALIEHPSFIPDLTGYENLLLLAKIQKKIGHKEIEEALNNVNLYKEKDKSYSSYSLGMKQKLGIAQVLMENPSIIILDEPFNGIERETVEKISENLKRLKKEGKTILLTSHHKEDIENLADVVYKFEDGKVIQIKD